MSNTVNAPGPSTAPSKVIRVDIVVPDPNSSPSLNAEIADWPKGLVTSYDLVVSLILSGQVSVTITSIEDLS